jgi:ParB-like nuclease family protein
LALAKAGFTLGIKPLGALRPHEETIKSHVQGLAAEMKREGVQKDPIIIDRETLTVLDGMHRLAAFGALEIENAVCCAVDYSSKAVALGRWARVYSLRDRGAIGEALRRFGVTKRVTLASAFDALEGREAGLAVLTSEAAYVPERGFDLAQAMGAMTSFDQLAESEGWSRRFVPEDDVDVPLQSEGNIVVLVRKLRKDDVVGAARSGRLFPCKTSMHLIDPRPVAVNFPISELNDATSASLRKMLEAKKGQLLPPDSTYEGRRYKERLLLLSQD